MNLSYAETDPFANARKYIPKTPQPMRQARSQDLVELTLSNIAETQTKIKEISSKNTEAHKKCIKLQHSLNSMTTALDKNIDFLQKVCRMQKEENEQLHQKLQHKTEIAEKIQMLLDKCANSGVDVNKIPGLDVKTLSEYFIIRPPVDEGVQLDPTIKTIVDSNSLFTGITTNEEFVDKCIELKDEAMRPFSKSMLESGEVSENVLTLRKQLAELQQNNSTTQARMAREMSDLLAEKQRLQKQLEEFKRPKQSSFMSTPKSSSSKRSHRSRRSSHHHDDSDYTPKHFTPHSKRSSFV